MTEKQNHLVTGGGGYVGCRLAKALIEKGHHVVLFDVKTPENIPEGASFIQGDIRDYDSVHGAFSQADCVYHLASYGMSGREQLNKKLIKEVNIGGTKNVIKACCAHSIDRLVYTSTFNVIFGGQTIENGDESLPYLPLEKHPDQYSLTKSIAEMTILEANGAKLDNGNTLKTCALRLAGVYGPGEQRHLPRIVGLIKQGLFCMVYGDPDSLVEFLHIDNLVQAHVKGAEALTPEQKSVAAGQPYFISDCKPVNNFEFFRPLVEGLGYKFPTLRLPVGLIYYIACLIELIHGVIGRVYNFQPLLTCTEVYKTGVTHYFSNDKAKKDMGYSPTVQNDMQEAVQWFIDRGHSKPKKSFIKQLFVDICLAVIFAMFIMSFLPIVR